MKVHFLAARHIYGGKFRAATGIQGLGSLFFTIDPADSGECEVSEASSGCNGRVTIRVGSDRYDTCGF